MCGGQSRELYLDSGVSCFLISRQSSLGQNLSTRWMVNYIPSMGEGAEADPGFFLGGGALVSCSTLTPKKTT